MSNRALATVALGLMLRAAPAVADPPPTRAHVVSALSGYEHGPDATTVRAWGAAGSALLMDVANDANALNQVRARALYALRLFPDSAPVHDYLRQFAARGPQPAMLQHAAFDALAEGFADVAELTRYLHDPDFSVRDGAAWSLSRVATPAARAALETALRTETHPTVRTTLLTALPARTTH